MIFFKYCEKCEKKFKPAGKYSKKCDDCQMKKGRIKKK